MPVVEITETHPCPPAVLFALLRRPAVLVALAPSDFGLTLLDGPDLLDAGSSYTVQGTAGGCPRRSSPPSPNVYPTNPSSKYRRAARSAPGDCSAGSARSTAAAN